MILAMGLHVHAFISRHIFNRGLTSLSLPVVLWAGYPILQRWVSYKTGHLNMEFDQVLGYWPHLFIV